MLNPGNDILQLEPGDQRFWVYESDKDHRMVLTAFIEQGLSKGERIILASAELEGYGVESRLWKKHPEILAAIIDGRICVVSIQARDESQDEDPSEVFFDRLGGAIANAKQNDDEIVRVVANLSVLFSGERGLRNLLDYEVRLDRLIKETKCAALWPVRVQNLDPLTLLGVLGTNARVIIGKHILPELENIPPEEFKGSRYPGLTMYRWMETLALRKKTELDLGIQDTWFRDILDTIYQIVGVMKPDGTLLEVNKAALAFGGIKRSDVIGQPFWKARWWSISSQTQTQLKKAIVRAARGEFIRYEVDVAGQGNDGETIRTIDFSITPVFDSKGNVVLLISEGRDLTEIIQAKKAFMDREILLDSVINNAPIALFLVDRQGTILLSAGKGREGLNRSRSNTKGRSIHEVYQDVPAIIQNFHRALDGETVMTYVEIDGYGFDTRYTPFVDDKGNIVGVLGVATDITRHKKAENALYTSRARFQTIFEESELGIALEDLDGRVIESNPAFQKMLGYTAAELNMKSFTEFTHPADLDENLELYKAMAAGRRDTFRLEKRYIRKDGRIVWGRLITSIVWGLDGKPEAIIVMVEDITAKRQMEAELYEVQRRLMQSREQERLHMAQEIHDGPLQELYAIVFKLKDLEMGMTSDEKTELLHSIQEDVQHQIQTLRAFCGELRPPSLAPFGLEKAIRSHADSFTSAHPEMTVTLELMPDRNQLTEQVRMALYRIYQELLHNVIRHSQATQLVIRLQVNDDKVILEVDDNGKGFGLPRRWIDLARENHLGLIGAQERAESVGGNLEIVSKIGTGTQVRVVVPRHPVDANITGEEVIPKSYLNQDLSWTEETLTDLPG